MEIFKIKDRMYQEKIFLIYDCSLKDLNKYLYKKHRMITTLSTSSDGGSFKADNINYIWLEKFDWSIAHQGILHHEIFHCSTTILMELGMILSDDSDEAFAYYHQHLTMEFLEGMKKSHPLSKENKP